MSQTEQTQETAAGEQPTEAGEPSERAERIAKAVLVAVALLAAWGLVAAMPEIAYVVTGILICLGWQKARARLTRRDDDDEAGQEPEEDRGPDPLDAVIALHALSRGNSVLLTALRAELELPDTKAVKALLDEAGVTWKAVRTPTGNGPGVHKDDIPPMVSPAVDPHDERCCCRSDDNNNADSATGDAPQKGTRVEAIGDGGRRVSEVADHTCKNRPAPDPDDA
ncbi:hypothetical protein ACKI1J_24245 [Streptomyces scabiei]|uniref:hypothetical protein n=1 Tax=Streptomyces TaxID=1883 RepID=UPI0038F7596A